VRYKNWKVYFSMVGACANCGLKGVEDYKWAQVGNLRRDPFESAVGLRSLTEEVQRMLEMYYFCGHGFQSEGAVDTIVKVLIRQSWR